jgi:hypothetical protein
MTKLQISTPDLCDCVARAVASTWNAEDERLAKSENLLSPRVVQMWPRAVLVCAEQLAP